MSQPDNEYDVDVAVEFIQNHLPQELKEKFSNDDIYYIIDTIEEFMDDEKNWKEEDEEAFEENLVNFVIKETKKDGIGNYTAEEILFVIQAELDYSETLGEF
ncbi:MAG: hypothetical protein ACRCTF_10170 [Bacteroidales bacterium]